MNFKETNNKTEVRRIDTEGYQEFYITVNDYVLNDTSLKKLFLKLDNEEILINKLVFFGNLQKIKKLIPVVAGKFPFQIIGDSLPRKIVGEKVSLYINGIKVLKGQSQKVVLDGEVIGSYFDFPDFEYLSVSGTYLKNKQANFKKEAMGEYVKIAKVLAQYKFEAKNIHRFWNYMSQIWKNYPDFNAARNAYFKKNNIIKFPAATGIEARLGFGKKINLGFEATKPKRNSQIRWKPISFNLQAEPHKYNRQVSSMPQGPKFSRAVSLSFPKSKIEKFYVSGISSANALGESSLTDDMSKNVAYVMSSFERLLKKGGFSLKNLVSSHVYFKNKEIFQEFEKLYAANEWNFPYNPVFTNICRPDFFFEIEGLASNESEKHSF